MSKIKMRCNTCGKWFQSANAKEVTCPDCLQKARKEKLAAKNAPPTATKGATASSPPKAVAPPPKPKPVQSGTNHWLDSLQDVKIAEPDQPPPRPKILPPPPREYQPNNEGPRAQSPSPANPREEYGQRRENFNRGPAPSREEGRRDPNNYRPSGPAQTGGPDNYRSNGPATYRPTGPNNYRPSGPGTYRPGGPGQTDRPDNFRPGGPGQAERPRQPMGGRGPRPAGPDGAGSQYKPKPRPKASGPRPAAPPRPKKEKIPPPEPFTPTPEQIQQVEERYTILATPAEFDGIRTQISQELSIPKKAVKQIIKEFRDRQHIPSWWEVQIYKGSNEELEKIKQAYLPYLPVPHVGIHKKISEELNIKAGVIYQAIKSIRLEMNLPQYNDPTFHEEELAAIRQQRAQSRLAHQQAQQAEAEKQAQQVSAEQQAPQDTQPEDATHDSEPKTVSSADTETGNAETVQETVQNEVAQ